MLAGLLLERHFVAVRRFDIGRQSHARPNLRQQSRGLRKPPRARHVAWRTASIRGALQKPVSPPPQHAQPDAAAVVEPHVQSPRTTKVTISSWAGGGGGASENSRHAECSAMNAPSEPPASGWQRFASWR